MCTAGGLLLSTISDLYGVDITFFENAFCCIFSFYEELLAQDILKPLVAPVEDMMSKEEGIMNYVTPHGVSSIVKHYLKESGRSFEFRFNLFPSISFLISSSGSAVSHIDIHYRSNVLVSERFVFIKK